MEKSKVAAFYFKATLELQQENNNKSPKCHNQVETKPNREIPFGTPNLDVR